MLLAAIMSCFSARRPARKRFGKSL
jgi:hypothetical protein